jgi:hypothetical protein
MSDLNKKTLRHFYCRDVLWQCFERMSEDFDRGVDDLVNEAMRLFAREKGYIAGENESRPTATHTAESEPIASPPPLYLIFQNQKYLIDKEQFIIGRGSKTSDLPIRDGNISRKHAAVIRRNGGYFIKDLGSTNGIDFNGTRVDNKQIEEGDVYSLCDYQLRFTYR